MWRKSRPVVGCGCWFLLKFAVFCRLFDVKLIVLERFVGLFLLFVVVGACLASTCSTVLSSGHEVVANNGRQRIFHNDCGAATFHGDVHGGCLLGGDIDILLFDVQCDDGIGRILTMEWRSSAK